MVRKAASRIRTTLASSMPDTTKTVFQWLAMAIAIVGGVGGIATTMFENKAHAQTARALLETKIVDVEKTIVLHSSELGHRPTNELARSNQTKIEDINDKLNAILRNQVKLGEHLKVRSLEVPR